MFSGKNVKLHFSILYHVHKLSWEIISKREKNIKDKNLPIIFFSFLLIKLNFIFETRLACVNIWSRTLTTEWNHLNCITWYLQKYGDSTVLQLDSICNLQFTYLIYLVFGSAPIYEKPKAETWLKREKEMRELASEFN